MFQSSRLMIFFLFFLWVLYTKYYKGFLLVLSLFNRSAKERMCHKLIYYLAREIKSQKLNRCESLRKRLRTLSLFEISHIYSRHKKNQAMLLPLLPGHIQDKHFLLNHPSFTCFLDARDSSHQHQQKREVVSHFALLFCRQRYKCQNEKSC